MFYAEPDELAPLNVETFRLDITQAPNLEDFILTVRGKRVGSFGNLVTVTGKPKARKTVFVHGIIAAAISKGEFYKIRVNLPDARRNVILLDTEQDRNDLLASMDRLARTMNAPLANFPHFRVYSLRLLSPAEVLKFIRLALEQTPGVGMLVVDGLLDTINDMNNVEEARAVMQEIKTVCDRFRVLLVGVLHQSKGSNFSIGHLGSFADRFAQSVLGVEKDPKTENSTLAAVYMRSDGHFEPVEIYFNHRMNTYTTTDWDTREADEAPF